MTRRAAHRDRRPGPHPDAEPPAVAQCAVVCAAQTVLCRAARRRGRRCRRRRHPDRRRPGVLRGARPQGARRHHRAARYLAEVAADDQTGDRRHQRRGRHRRPGARAVLRHPDRLRAGPVRRHPRQGGAAADVGPVGAAAAEGRRRHGPPDEPDRGLPVGPRRAARRAGHRGGGPRRAAADRAADRRIDRRQQPERGARAAGVLPPHRRIADRSTACGSRPRRRGSG